MEIDGKSGAADASKEGEKAEAAKPKAPEALSHRLDNPSRVTPAQQKFVIYDETSRWRAIHPGRPVTGIIVFKDLEPGVNLDIARGPETPASHPFPAMETSSPMPSPFAAALLLSMDCRVTIVTC